MKRRFLLVLAITLLVVASGAAGGAASPPVGSATTNLSIISVTGSEIPSLEVSRITGLATTDPGRIRPSTFARMQYVPSRVDEESEDEVTVEADAEKGYDSFSQTVPTPVELPKPPSVPLVSMSYTLGLTEASVPNSLEAYASLGQLKFNADILSGLIVLEDVTTGVNDGSNTSMAESSQTVEFAKISFFPFGKLIDVGSLSVEELLKMAESVAPAGSTGPVEQARADLIAALGDEPLLKAAVEAALLLLGKDLNSATYEELIKAVDDAESSLGLDLGLTDPLKQAIDDLRAIVGSIALLTWQNFKSGVKAEATDGGSSASAEIIDAGTMKVASIDVPVDKVGEEIEKLVTTLKVDVSVLDKLVVKITPLAKVTEPTEFMSPYWTANAGFTGLVIELSINPSYVVKVLSLEAFAEHKPAVVDPPPPGLANTGPEQLWIVAGMVLLGAGVLLFRSIRGA